MSKSLTYEAKTRFLRGSGFFGSGYAAVYDLVMSRVPYESWADYTEDILLFYGVDGKSVLDLACGTGSLSIILARRGFYVTAVDRSKHMLAQLSKKTRKANFWDRVNIVNARISHFRSDRSYDCAVCYFDSLNYILNIEELQQIFRTVSEHLKPEGLFVFDVNTIGGYESGVFNRSGRIMFGSSDVRYQFSGRFDSCTLIAKVCLRFSPRGGNRQKHFCETHLQRAYKENEIRECLGMASFEVADLFKAFSFTPARDTDDRWTFVAQKTKGR